MEVTSLSFNVFVSVLSRPEQTNITSQSTPNHPSGLRKTEKVNFPRKINQSLSYWTSEQIQVYNDCLASASCISVGEEAEMFRGNALLLGWVEVAGKQS